MVQFFRATNPIIDLNGSSSIWMDTDYFYITHCGLDRHLNYVVYGVVFFFSPMFRDTHTSEFDWHKNVISNGPISKSNPPDSIKQEKAAGLLK